MVTASPPIYNYSITLTLRRAEQRDTCPMCRSVASKEDSWLLMEAGDTTQEISAFLQEFITQLSKPSS